MKNSTIILLLYLIGVSLGCSNSDSLKRQENEEPRVSQIEKPAPEAKVDVNGIPTLRTLYVTNPKGGNIYDKPDKQSVVLDTLEYGYKVEVIGEAAGWYKIKERIMRDFVRDGQQTYSYGWEVVNIPKPDVGPLSQVKLTDKDLYLTSDDVPIRGRLRISLIGKDEFGKPKEGNDKFIVPLDSLVSEEDSVLVVSTGNGQKKKFVSSPNAEEDRKNYSYVGHSELLSAFLLAIEYYEDGEFKLYGSGSGEEIISFNDYPFISPDGRHAVSLYTNPYDYTTDFQLYRINDNKSIKKVLEASFGKWMAATGPQGVVH
ncbi:SH3 domain-containing protein [Rufibacter quisquiliarum]|uniref:SH3b domain-containing protein n=1 Tax=Rufibacter quisquiliarum TaxID=1549639 RepID=A0A839GZP0_9BACT|nr:SH3 domain-containing protein [Rufibacter quisquiliarum]MBA9079908.1 hypothetical protein [Rufibacter quisquiliarum]